MDLARKIIFTLVGCLSCTEARTQVNLCSSSQPSSSKLICLVPFSTQTVTANQTPSNAALQNSSIFNGPIGAQLSQLPLAVSAPGAIILTVNGNPERFDNLGPVLLDRPDSVGKGRLVFGFSAQQFNFNHLDGIGIGAIPLVVATQNSSGLYPTQYLQQTVHVSLKLNQYVLLATYGLPKKTDVSVIVPFTRVSIGAANLAPTTYFISSQNTLGPISTFNNSAYVPGSASGPGDVTVNVKHVLWSGGEAGRGSLATGAAFRFPTGDALNYLGSGAYGFNAYGLVSYKRRLSPHAKIAYQWNTNSVLLNISQTPGQDSSLPGGFQYGAGADFGLLRGLTASGDILANQFVNSPYIARGAITIPVSSATTASASQPTCSSTPVNGASTQTLCTITTSTSTYTTANLSMGLKWKPFRRQNIIAYGNVLIQLNDVGLRSDASPSFGISYRFGSGR